MFIFLFLSLFQSTTQSFDIVNKRKPADIAQFPWSATLIAFKDTYEHAICSAFLLTPIFAGTATHCTKKPGLLSENFRYKVG